MSESNLISAIKNKEYNMSKNINCDQMMWLQNALSRYANLYHGVMAHYPKIAGNYADTAQVSCLIEIMEILDLQVDSDSTESNLLSKVKSLIPKPKANPCQNPN